MPNLFEIPVVARRRVHSRGARRGVTLLEVLVAMGVMIVGLLGMLALIPLGRMELVEAEKMDNASTLGRWAFRDVSVRGYLQPENWLDPVTGDPVFGDSTDTGIPYSLMVGTRKRNFAVNKGGVLVPPVAPIVIDPLMISPRRFPSTSLDAAQRQLAGVFPYSFSLSGDKSGMPESMTLAPRLARVTLRAFPSDVVATDRTKLMMNCDVASRFMRATDDLNFKVPSDTSRRPIQVYSRSSNSNTTFYTNNGFDFENEKLAVDKIAARSFRGDYSWFLVAEPNLAEFYSDSTANSPAMGGPSASAVGIRQYRVWVVVCHQRPLTAIADQSMTVPEGIGERLVYVDFVDRNTARIRVGGMKNEADALAALNIKANQWIAVVGRYEEPMVPGGFRYVMEWYRLTGVGDRPTHIKETTQWYREATVVGREFSGLGFTFIDEDKDTKYEDLNTSMTGGNSDIPLVTGWGIIVSGARAVYEKSIYVDRPSLYSIRY